MWVREECQEPHKPHQINHKCTMHRSLTMCSQMLVVKIWFFSSYKKMKNHDQQINWKRLINIWRPWWARLGLSRAKMPKPAQSVEMQYLRTTSMICIRLRPSPTVRVWEASWTGRSSRLYLCNRLSSNLPWFSPWTVSAQAIWQLNTSSTQRETIAANSSSFIITLSFVPQDKHYFLMKCWTIDENILESMCSSRLNRKLKCCKHINWETG